MNKDLLLLTDEYKMAVINYERAEKIKEEVRKKLILEMEEAKQYEVNGIKATKIQPQPTIDWKAVQMHYKLTIEKLKPFMKERAQHYQITFVKEIVVKKEIDKLIDLLY